MSSAPFSGLGTPTGSARCRACQARLRPEENWCSLCHQSVREAAGSALSEPSAPESEAPVAFPPPADPAIVAAADRLLAALATGEADHGRDRGLAAFRKRFGTRGGALVVAGFGGILLLVLGLLALTLLGLLL